MTVCTISVKVSAMIYVLLYYTLIKNMHSLGLIGYLARQTKDESQEALAAKFYYKQLRYRSPVYTE